MSSRVKSSTSLVPEGRFPGFSDPWVHEPLSSVLTEHKVKNAGGHDVFSVSMESGIVNQIEHLGRSFAAADTSHYNVGHRFDVVYTKSPLKAFPFGIVKQCKFEGVVALSPLYGVFTPKNRHVGLMIEAFFEAPERAQAFLSPLCQKGAKNTLQITNATFLSGKMALPKEEGEQQKIADCLDSADALIAAQVRKVEALRAHKKGLMQQLFPQEGETQPRLRFPEFEGAGDWSVKPLGKVAQNLDSKRVPITSGSRVAGDVPYYGASGIVDYVEGYIFDEDLLCVSEDGANLLARTYPIAFAISGKTWVNNHAHVLRFKHSFTQKFVEVYLNSIKLDDFITGMAQPKLNKANLDSIPIPLPEKPEQQRIADCLTSLDDLIAVEARKLDTLKTHKRGLTQQLFPQVGEDDA